MLVREADILYSIFSVSVLQANCAYCWTQIYSVPDWLLITNLLQPFPYYLQKMIVSFSVKSHCFNAKSVSESKREAHMQIVYGHRTAAGQSDVNFQCPWSTLNVGL